MKEIKKNIINYGKQRILKEMESLLTKEVLGFILKKNTEEEKRMKRRVAIILALVMAIGVVTGCGKKADTGSSAKSEEQNGKKDTVVVAVDSDDHEGFVPWNSIGVIVYG